MRLEGAGGSRRGGGPRPGVRGPTTSGRRLPSSHAAIDAGIARGALDEAAAFVRAKARHCFEVKRGESRGRPAAGPAGGRAGGDRPGGGDAAGRRAGRQRMRPRRAGRGALDAQQGGARLDRVCYRQAAADQAAVDAASALFELGGTRGAHWPEPGPALAQRTHAHPLHDPVRWAAAHRSRWTLTGTPAALARLCYDPSGSWSWDRPSRRARTKWAATALASRARWRVLGAWWSTVI